MHLGYPNAATLDTATDPDAHYHDLADWIEASVLLGGELSKTQVADTIDENEFSSEQDEINLAVESAWTELRRRSQLMAGRGLEVDGQWVRPPGGWRENAAYSFCVVVSLSRLYTGWEDLFDPHYQLQGGLFEELVEESLEAWEWQTLRTGWRPDQTSQIEEVVADLSRELNEPSRDVQPYATSTAKEEGLDVACWKPFRDGWTGKPLYLIQCGSGKHWTGKIKKPDMKVWKKLIDFGSNACGGFATPFALTEDGFRRYSNRSGGLFMDRYRVVAPPEVDEAFLSQGLEQRLIDYLEDRLDGIPTLY